MTRVTRLHGRTLAAALPAFALIGGRLAMVATDGSPSTDVVADSSPLVTVLRTAVQRPEAPSLPPLPGQTPSSTSTSSPAPSPTTPKRTPTPTTSTTTKKPPVTCSRSTAGA